MKRIVGILLVVLSGSVGAERVPGDIDGSGKVDFQDFLVLAKNFGKSGDPAPLDGDQEASPLSIAPLNERGFPLDIGNRWTYQKSKTCTAS